MKTIHIKAASRGHANHGWLQVNHMFSFAGYYNPERMNFGDLRVLNDDIIAGGKGFPTHPHDNMEIITVPLEGSLKHKDSMGHEDTVKKGEIQVMSAGTGIYHSETNGDAKEDANICQIWIMPNQQAVEPRYDKIEFSMDRNKLQQLISPNSDDAGSWIHSDSWFNHGEFDKDEKINYSIHKEGNGMFIFLIEGQIDVNGHKVSRRDGFGIWEENELDIEFTEDGRILILEVPTEA